MMFPFMMNQSDVQVSQPVFREYDFDFDKGQLTGQIVEGKEALKVWVYKALKTKRYTHNIYSWDYGQELEDIIGQGYERDYVLSEVERYINDCLTVNEYITACHSFDIALVQDQLKVNFKVNTIYGEVTVDEL